MGSLQASPSSPACPQPPTRLACAWRGAEACSTGPLPSSRRLGRRAARCLSMTCRSVCVKFCGQALLKALGMRV